MSKEDAKGLDFKLSYPLVPFDEFPVKLRSNSVPFEVFGDCKFGIGFVVITAEEFRDSEFGI